MPNETPKSECCNAPWQVSDPNHCSYCGYYFVARKPTPKQSLRDQWEQEADGHKPTETIYPPTKEQIAKQCTCGLQAHPQPNCPAAKQPDEMPDVIYAVLHRNARANVIFGDWYDQQLHDDIPYIRKSIHDEQKELASKYRSLLYGCDKHKLWEGCSCIGCLEDEITKLKSALKECVESLKGCELALDVLKTFHRHSETWKTFAITDKIEQAREAITSAKGLYE